MTPADDEDTSASADDDDMSAEADAAYQKIGACFSDVIETLDGDFELAIWMFRDFVASIKLPREPRRSKPKSRRDAKLMAEYEAAKRGTREAILRDFEKSNSLKKGSAIQIIRRHRRQSAQRVFSAYAKQSPDEGDN